MKHVIAGTAGHIDHGKSALVKALTGTDPDRLKEEQLRGITIDLGFAHLDLGDVQVGFVDVPGHEKFVKNMLAGVGGIDFVILTVAADESVMPQTREHFDICRLLGIPAGIVALTKTDLVEPDLLELVKEEVRETVRGSFLDDAPVIPLSVRTGEGLDALRGAIHDLAVGLPRRQSDRVLRLPVDRAFTIHGFGTVVTGTLMTGEIRREQEVELVPSGAISRVRGLQVHGRPTEIAVAGQRTAVNLQSIELDQVQRGMVVTAPRQFRPGALLDVHLSLLPSAPPLRSLRKVRFHHGTSEVLARVALMGSEVLEAGGGCFAQLRLDRPVFCLHGDRFILRQFSPAVTIGGGTVLHPHPTKHRSTDIASVELLAGLEKGGVFEKIVAFVRAHPRPSISLHELNASLGLPEPDLRKEVDRLAASGRLTVLNGPTTTLLLPDTLSALQQRTLEVVREFHEHNPLQRGVSREELRRRVFGDHPPEVFRHALETLAAASKLALLDEVVSIHGRAVRLTPEEQRIQAEIEALFRRSGNQPPVFSELTAAIAADPSNVRRIYFWMIRDKILVKISDDLSYLRETIEAIKTQIGAKYPRGSKFGVAEFKEMFDLTRKHAIPLLEYFDRERLTRRSGNERILL